MTGEFFYEEINRAGLDIPPMEALHNLQYCSHYHEEIELMLVVDGMIIRLDFTAHHSFPDIILNRIALNTAMISPRSTDMALAIPALGVA